MRKKTVGFGRKKRNKVLRKMIKLGLIIALLFFLLSAALDILTNFSNDWDILIKRHHQQTITIETLQQEIEILKSKVTAADAKASFAEAAVLHQNEMINDIQESLNQPLWSNEGVTYQYQVIESTEAYDVIEPVAEPSAQIAEMPGFFSNAWIAPIIIGGGIIIKGLLWSRGIPAF